MKNKLLILAFLPFVCSCGKSTLSVIVSNDRDFDAVNEIVEADASSLISNFKDGDFAIYNATGVEMPYQITYNDKVIFPASVKSHTQSKYKVKKGRRAIVDTLSTGRLYPERHDDMAWENDKIGFRAYGPESQRLGDRLYGYDIFLKRDTSSPIIESLMALNNSQEIQARIDSLRRAGLRDQAKALDDAKSYHIDHGVGMDCYAVGPTLGACTSAVVDSSKIYYPWCFSDYQILDRGPLRFTVVLRFPPAEIGSDIVKEQRIISLDAGSHLNYTQVAYEGVTLPCKVITGIVIHEGSNLLSCESDDRFIAYADPTQGSDNGQIYIGAVFPQVPEAECVSTYGDVSHVSAFNTLTDTNRLVYYWGAGWNRSDIADWDAWLEYLKKEAVKIVNPLKVEIR